MRPLLLLTSALALIAAEPGSCGESDFGDVSLPPEGDDVDEGPRSCEAPSLRFPDAATWPDGRYGLWGVTDRQHWGCTFELRGGEVDDIGWNGCATGANVFTDGESLFFITPPPLGARFRLLATYEDEPFLSDVWVDPLAGEACRLGLADVRGSP